MKSATTNASQPSHGRSPRQEFARRLSALHRAAGAPSLRNVAMLAQQRGDEVTGKGRSALASAQRISDWMSGRNVPAKFESLLPVLQVLAARARRRSGAPGETVNLRAWRALWAAARTAPTGPSAGPAAQLYPEQGTYLREHETVFFGRQRALASLLELVRASASPHRAADLVVLTGASGIGKSSLLRAGVLAVLGAETERWSTAITTPSTSATHTLNRIFSDIADFVDNAGGDARVQPDRRPLLVVDQFEELFDPGVEPAVRESFLLSLKRLCTVGSVIVAVRSDHLAECAQYPWLAHAIQHNSFTLNPMTRQELTSAIVGPPRTRGVTVDPGVVELLLTALETPRYSVDRQNADPGVLPVLHATMRSMWSCHSENRLEVADYRRVGGPERTVRALAEQAWARLSPDEQADARQILLALVTVHRDGSVTRRRLAGAELRRIAGQTPSGAKLADRLVRARLVTVDYKHATLVHETLLGWERLAGWISEHRTALLWRHRIEDDATEWDAADRDPGLLYRSVRLTSAVRHASPALSAVATDFLRASARAELSSPETREGLSTEPPDPNGPSARPPRGPSEYIRS
ncbi:ATP-binding protein [Nocardia blacklockiae]|uniref:ATP-binding protein n=1 Tax=Nocardia blacklockiae TaxID=480036 RepID=UPI001893176C|nr:ATP-binding protein [Nocardia blacklockiae]MBF6171644.1 ATP-binding protein [Nocardia blacklockiae]